MSEDTPTLRETIEAIAGDEVDGEKVVVDHDEISIAEASEEVANVPEAGGETENEAQAAIQSIEPPNSWRADKKELFRSLPPEIQNHPQIKEILEYAVERERERDSYLNQKGQKYSGLDKVFEPHVNDWERKGLSPDRVVTQLLAWDKFITERPFDAIQELAARNNIDLAQFAKVQEMQGPQDPYVKYTLAEVERLKSEQAEERQRLADEREAQTYQGLTQEIERFKLSTKDGRPAYPYFESVREDMAAILPRVIAENPNAQTHEALQESYERAVRANPKTYEAYRQDQDTKRELENRQRIKAKRYAGSSVSGSPEGGKIDKPMTLRETIEAAAAGRL